METRDVSGSTSQPEYRFLTEFQSHESEFDYLKSQEIEEKINLIVFIVLLNITIKITINIHLIFYIIDILILT